jgi:hypothetical protein
MIIDKDIAEKYILNNYTDLMQLKHIIIYFQK